MRKTLQIINISSFIVLALVNYLAVSTPFFGRRPGDVSDLYPNPFTPADFAFRIWTFIYVLLILFIVRQSRGLWPKAQPAPKEVSLIGYLFLITSLCNIGWLLAWQSLHIVLAFAFIFIMWALLIRVYYRLATWGKAHWAFTVPFSFYLAWVAVAALANLNVSLMDLQFGFFGLEPEPWTAILVGLGTFGGLLVLYLNKDLSFALVIVWALFGIYVKNNAGSTNSNLVVSSALIGMAILAIAMAFAGIQNLRNDQGQSG